MAERRFTRGLSKPGSAAQVRETVSQAVRESAVLARPILVEPIDYEEFLRKNHFLLQNDPQRDMILYPLDDVSQTTQPRRYRTTVPSVPCASAQEADSLFVKECIKTYQSSWHVVHYKYSAYSGNYWQLPRIPKVEHLEDLVYEVDAESDLSDLESYSTSEEILKQGYLLKGPEATNIIAIATQSFKRRFVQLRQEVDGTYTLEFHKDDKKREVKGTICMDFCSDVVKNCKRGKLCFELRMKDSQKSYLLMAENENDYEDWVDKFQTVIIQTSKLEETRKLYIEYKATDTPPATPENRGTLKSLEHSRNPELMKYARETDSSIALARKEIRQKLFSIYPETFKPQCHKESEEPGIETFREPFGTRIIVRCDSIRFRLQVPLDSERGSLCQVEPYFTTLSLYDVKRGKKISSDFRFDVNHPALRGMIPQYARKVDGSVSNGDSERNGDGKSTNGRTIPQELGDVSEEWLLYPKQALFSVSHPDSEIYLVVRIEKVLQGSISQAADLYTKNNDARVAPKIHKMVKSCCQRLGHYRMPFAWAAKPLFKLVSKEVDCDSEFNVIYKQDSAKLSDEDLLKCLADFKKPDKMNRIQTIPGTIKLSVLPCEKLIPNVLTSSLLPVRPFPIPPTHEPTFEVEEFHFNIAADSYPFTSYVNHLYVYPKSLKYDTQKSFTKARNIACIVEFRDDDDDDSKPIKCIYGRPGDAIFVSQANCSVVHHSTSPDFYEEIKIALPPHLHEKHHLLFTFMHVSCELPKGAKRRDAVVENVIGYSWIALLPKGRLNVEEQHIPVAAHLAPGYLSVEPFGLGKGFSGPDIRWVDGQKQLFKVDFRLISTIYTKDQHMHNFFAHMQKLFETKIPIGEGDTCKNIKDESRTSTSDLGREISKYVKVTHQVSKALKALHAVDVGTIISYLPTLMNKLFHLLVNTSSNDVALNAVRVLVHIITIVHDAGKSDLLQSYVKYVFQIETINKYNPVTIHEELVKSIIILLEPENTDFLVVNKFLRHTWFFFQILVKSMAQYILSSNQTKDRCDRFSKEFHTILTKLIHVLVPQILNKYKDLPTETKHANLSFAVFIKKCLTFMDRGFVFKLINYYMDKFNLGDPKVLQEYKFTFLQTIIAHEHYISLNLPLLRIRAGRNGHFNMKELEHEYCLSEEFCRHHFLVGLLLQEVRTALNEVRDVRKIAISVLRNILAKHSFDDRYQLKVQQARVASLYLPLITIILENLNRLNGLSSQLTTPARVCNGSISAVETPLNSPHAGSSRFSLYPETSPTLHPKHQRDSSYLSVIAGQGILTMGSSTSSSLSLSSSSSSTMSNTSQASQEREKDREDKVDSGRHSRSQSLPFTGQVPVRYDKLDETEVKDLLVCFLYIIKNINEELLIGWWQHCSENDALEFFQVLEICLHQFKYLGKKLISSRNQVSASGQPKAMTLPARMAPPNFSGRSVSAYSETSTMPNPTADADALYRALLEANMATEVGLTCLDALGLYMSHFKDQLLMNDGDNLLMRKLCDICISFLQVGQSEKLQRHVFASLRAYVNKFPVALFKGNAIICGKFCYEILRCCNSKLSTTRNEACALLYLLMRSNYEFTGKKGLTRVHLQVIISVSQLLGEITGLNNSCFQESLSIINNYANTDKGMQSTSFPAEVKDLTKRIRTVLMATTQMREHEHDPEMLIDLQYNLANSYAATPELRKTWLETMAQHHIKYGNLSEAAHCYIHIAALVSEYLKQKGIISEGSKAFSKLSPNVEQDESGLKEDTGMQDIHYSEDTLLELLEDCAEFLEQAERYELIGHVYQVIVPIYEKRRDYEALAMCYKRLHTACTKIVEVNKSGKRLLGKYYRVAFFGQPYFEDDSGKEYIYKEPKVTSLAEISERLYHLYCDKFGKENVKMIMDSVQVDQKDLDSKYAYIQVTHVTPYFDDSELLQRPMEFDRNNNLQRFMFETPFTKGGKARGSLEEQCKRKTVLKTVYSFPYIKKRIPIHNKQVMELTPIEVAIEEMQTRVVELQEEINCKSIDLKRLQLKLQGSISVQVNAGPLAYAAAFLDDKIAPKYPKEKVKVLKDVYRHFIRTSGKALELNGKLIVADQIEYQEAMKATFRDLMASLGEILHEKFSSDDKSSHASRDSCVMLNYISATSGSSTV